jgi:hypothetical protein
MSENKVGRNSSHVNRTLFKRVSDDIPDRVRRALKRYFEAADGDSIRYVYDYSQSTSLNSEIENNKLIITLKSGTSTKAITDYAKVADTSTTFLDHSYRKVLPMDKDTLDRLNKVGITSYVDAESFYTFYAKVYESALSQNPSLSENVLPSFYALYSEAIYEQENVKPLNDLDGKFETDLKEGFMSSFDEEKSSSRFLDYFEDYGTKVIDILSQNNGSEVLKNLGERYSTYVFTDSSMPLFTSEASRAASFPMYNKLSFSTDKNTSFANVLKELKIEKQLAREIAGTPPDNLVEFANSEEQYSISGSSSPSVSNSFFTEDLKTWDVKEWIAEKLFDSTPVGTEIGEKQELKSPSDTAIEKLFTKILLSAKTNKIVEDKIRTTKEMLDGKSAYSEAVMYKIEKYDYADAESKNSNPVPIASFYIPNSSQLDVCDFVDTQIKYGKRYKYVIYSYDMVIGNSYSYPNATYKNKTLTIDVDNSPSVKIIQNKMSELEDVVCVDSPPMPPEVSFVPYRDINDKILININSSTGDRVLTPVVVEPSDSDSFELVKKSQRRIDDKIRFKSDDISAIFEVFRVTDKPSSYRDFGGKKYTEISTGQSSAAALKDKIEPNRDYYYCLRIRDVHGNISNPSVIYKVRMEDLENGPHFLDVSVLDENELKVPQDKEISKSMRRYVQIIPTVSQGLLNVGESDLLEATTVDGVTNVVLGVADESLWDKRFKIRFTSSKTGRKVDLDVKFVVRHKVKQT